MAELRIRPPRPEDAAALHDVRTQPRVIAGSTALPSWRLAEQRRRLEEMGPDTHMFVAEADGRVVGMAELRIQRGRRRHVGELAVSVHDDFQHRGIGRALLQALLQLADEHLGLGRLELEVLHDNEPAIRLYQALGFQTEGRKRRAILRAGRFEDVLVMGRLRPPPESGKPVRPGAVPRASSRRRRTERGGAASAG